MRLITDIKWYIIYLVLFSKPAFALCVNAHRANLRYGPGTQYDKTWEVYKYMPFRKIRKKGHWYRVKDVDGESHWIYSKLTTSAFRCATVKAPRANLRTGPGTQYKLKPLISSAERYTSFKLIRVKGNWAKLKGEYGNVVWISKKLLWIQ